MTFQRYHAERQRAESFGSVAEQYDRFRPSYPAALIDDLVALGPVEVLDIGCGTGKAARPLVQRGLSVLGVEIDAQMCGVARAHGLDVETAPFETWDPAGRRFDLIVSGQAWHWVDPTIGVPKAATLLRPGGTIALFWNSDDLDEQIEAELAGVYRFRAPELARRKEDSRRADPPYVSDLYGSGLFEKPFTRDYRWEHTYLCEEWVQLIQTQSDHLTLDPRTRAAVVADVADVIDAHGGSVLAKYRTYAVFAHVPSP